jgi:hypothetical protein
MTTVLHRPDTMCHVAKYLHTLHAIFTSVPAVIPPVDMYRTIISYSAFGNSWEFQIPTNFFFLYTISGNPSRALVYYHWVRSLKWADLLSVVSCIKNHIISSHSASIMA